jgi:uncharacterized membrane protein
MAQQGPSWKLRRRAVFGSLLFAAIIIVYVAIRWDNTDIGDTLALGAFGLMGAVVASYIGGAAYQDVRLWRSMSLENKNTYSNETTNDFEENIEMPIEDGRHV